MKIQAFNSNTVSGKNKIKTNRKTILNSKMESRTLKSYNLAFKKQVLTRLEENDSNIENIACELNIQRKN